MQRKANLSNFFFFFKKKSRLKKVLSNSEDLKIDRWLIEENNEDQDECGSAGVNDQVSSILFSV